MTVRWRLEMSRVGGVDWHRMALGFFVSLSVSQDDHECVKLPLIVPWKRRYDTFSMYKVVCL